MNIAVIPDCQVRDGVPTDHLTWAGKYITAKRPDVIVCIGDFADMPSLSSHDTGTRAFEGRRYRKDIDAARRGMDKLITPLGQAKGYSPRMVLTLGNHEDRITRTIESDAKLDGTISLDDLEYSEAGWQVYPFLKGVKIGGVTFCHYMTSGVMGLPCKTPASIISKHHMSCVVGHQQGKQIAYARRGDGTAITAIIAGSFYQHNEPYLKPLENVHWRGMFFLHSVRGGQFDEMFLSIDYLKRRFK